jgi:hypothetical protein
MDWEPVNDPELEKSILAMVNQLIEPEAASKIDFVLVKDMPFLGLTVVDTDKERHWGTCRSYSHILINIKVKTMLENDEGKDIVYAILAHEIGHTMTCEDKYFEGEEMEHYYMEPCFLEWEIESDKKALILLKNIYDNPKEILLKQINYVLKNMYKNPKINIRLTMELNEKREKALMEI